MRFYPLVMSFFVTVLLLSNTVAVKVTHIGPFYFDGATILFPLAYIFNDVLTEVYGYKKSRMVVWTGFAAAAFMAFIYWAVGALPSAADWTGQEAYQQILGQTPRIVAASLTAYFFGEFSNSYILAKMKIATRGRWLWTRTIGSTVVGEFIDSLLFVVIAFYGVIPNELLLSMLISNYLFKTGYEILATPLTYAVTGWLKKAEKIDAYDYGTNFNPFRVRLDDLREE